MTGVYTTEQVRARLPYYLRQDLANGDDVLWRALFLRLGFSISGGVPTLMDYTGTTYQGDPTGRNSSWKALNQLAADVSGYTQAIRQKLIDGGLDPDDVAALPGVSAVGSPGLWVHDGLPLDFWYGSGLMESEGKIEGSKPGLFGCTILRPHRTGYDLEVPFPIHPGNRFRFAVHYPDRLSEAGNIDGAGAGDLVQYAPTFATDHCTDQTGVAASTNVSAYMGNVTITGANTGSYHGEATLSEEAWAVSALNGRAYSAQLGKACGGYAWDQRGACLDRGMVSNRVSVRAYAGSSGYGFGPQCWSDLIGTNLQAYMQANCVWHTFGHRATGFHGEANVRYCKTALRFLGGVPPPAWTGSLSGRDNGRYAKIRYLLPFCEATPNLVTWESDAFPTGVHIEADVIGSDAYSPTNTIPLLQHLTDKDIAGELRVRSGYPAGQWKPVTNFSPLVDYQVVSRTSVGPVIVVPAVSPQGLISFLPGSRFSSWNVNNKHATDQSGYGFQHLAAENNMILSFLGTRINSHFGSDYIFYGTEDADGQNTDPDASDFNPNLGMIKGIDREAMQYFGYTPSNLSHACNIQPFDGHGSYYAVGFPDGDDGDGGDDGGGDD